MSSEHGEAAMRDRLRLSSFKMFWKTVNANSVLIRQIKVNSNNLTVNNKDDKEVRFDVICLRLKIL